MDVDNKTLADLLEEAAVFLSVALQGDDFDQASRDTFDARVRELRTNESTLQLEPGGSMLWSMLDVAAGLLTNVTAHAAITPAIETAAYGFLWRYGEIVERAEAGGN